MDGSGLLKPGSGSAKKKPDPSGSGSETLVNTYLHFGEAPWMRIQIQEPKKNTFKKTTKVEHMYCEIYFLWSNGYTEESNLLDFKIEIDQSKFFCKHFSFRVFIFFHIFIFPPSICTWTLVANGHIQRFW